jgi:protein subunit release factor B
MAPDYPVSPAKMAELEADLRHYGIREEDFDEQFIRSGGHGGQNVNKVSTCVVLTHRPTGLSVRCQRERSQALNRFLARRLLLAKIAEKIEGALSKKKAEQAKIRRQKRKRSRRAKQKLLENKRIHAWKKAARRPVDGRED